LWISRANQQNARKTQRPEIGSVRERFWYTYQTLFECRSVDNVFILKMANYKFFGMEYCPRFFSYDMMKAATQGLTGASTRLRAN